MFAREERQSEAQSVTVQSLPIDVFAPAEQRSEVQVAEFRALPDDVFVPRQRMDHPNDFINPHALSAKESR